MSRSIYFLNQGTRAINSFVTNNGPAIDYNIVIREKKSISKEMSKTLEHTTDSTALPFCIKPCTSLYFTSLCFLFINSSVLLYFLWLVVKYDFGCDYSRLVTLAQSVCLCEAERRGKNCDEVCCNCPLF